MAAFQRISQPYRLAMTQARVTRRETSGWERHQLPEELGECYSERFALDNDLMVVRSRYHPTHDLIEETINPHGRPMLVITFGLQGHSGYKGCNGDALCFRAGYTTVTTFQSSHGERCYDAGATVSQLRLLVGENTLRKYVGTERADGLLGSGNIRQLAFRKSSGASNAHAGALTRYLSDPQSAAPLDMHIHALSLLAEQLHLLSPPAPETLQFSPRDVEKLERARDLMIEKMDQPLTIPYLCAAVGLNEFKLKEGFHYRFNTTPHRMLHELRMRKAYALLESGCQVAQAAYQVGYRYPNNFSAAFSAFFGKAPKSVFGKRRRETSSV
ncbi:MULTISPECIES: helix-turn-helix domain-containing protein [Pseudomonadaceae]|uniref:AraC-type DNA-binding protein n=1 Tax=Pseudomonas indica TaxID=137658 RepID=A0A1G8VLQ5_9PSED|nr:AraC family transcriptional regulator [Pseudomonas indica]MBU3057845.1 AraC family transcriptional regulator [Pseudomonas indica]PAU63579.1 AraC family transcriptional regulator [Pseudomonas indica]SDJ67001.1 AraC-type DNA-binding protein [Pseudomonas indica]